MSPASEESLAAKADRTLACVRQGIESGQVPMVSELIRIIREISAKADTLSIGELAEYIDREPSTMARIVAIANSLGYNPAGVQMTSVHQAIVAVGFERLRNLAISLLLLDQAQSPFTDRGQSRTGQPGAPERPLRRQPLPAAALGGARPGVCLRRPARLRTHAHGDLSGRRICDPGARCRE